MKRFSIDHYYDAESDNPENCTVIYLDIDGKNVWEFWYDNADYDYDISVLDEQIKEELAEFGIKVRGLDEVLDLAREEEEFNE